MTQWHAARLKKKRFGEDVEAIMLRLDRLTEDEARMTTAEIFKVIYGLVQDMNVVTDGEQLQSASLTSY